MRSFMFMLLGLFGIVTMAAAATTVNGHLVPTAGELRGTARELATSRLLGILTDAATIIDTNGANLTISGTAAITGAASVTGVLSCQTQYSDVTTIATDTATLSIAHTGGLFVATLASGATTVTIPDPSASTVGVVYYLMQTVDQNLAVRPVTANGNSLVADGVATSDLVTCQTAGHKIGSGLRVVGISATKWFVSALNSECPLTVEAAD